MRGLAGKLYMQSCHRLTIVSSLPAKMAPSYDFSVSYDTLPLNYFTSQFRGDLLEISDLLHSTLISAIKQCLLWIL